MRQSLQWMCSACGAQQAEQRHPCVSDRAGTARSDERSGCDVCERRSGPTRVHVQQQASRACLCERAVHR